MKHLLTFAIIAGVMLMVPGCASTDSVSSEESTVPISEKDAAPANEEKSTAQKIGETTGKVIAVILLIPVFAVAVVLAGIGSRSNHNTNYVNPGYQEDAYGPGIHSDQYGRPFKWQTQDGQSDPFLKVKPNAYGPGIGSDQYGRPVKAVPAY